MTRLEKGNLMAVILFGILVVIKATNTPNDVVGFSLTSVFLLLAVVAFIAFPLDHND